jgi:hypothetical protein
MVTDILGQEIALGDEVAVFFQARTARGTVTEITQRTVNRYDLKAGAFRPAVYTKVDFREGPGNNWNYTKRPQRIVVTKKAEVNVG